MAGKMKEHDGASPAKIFVGGLHKDTTMAMFREHFGRYGEITDAVIMKDRFTQKPRGFGFITYANASVVDTVIEENHVINGKQVEIKRTIPKGAAPAKDFKTKKIFVGGIPTTLKEDEFKAFFSTFGPVEEHEIIRDHATSRSRGFGFIVFDSEKTVDDLLAKKGNMIDLNGSQVEIKKAEPKKPSSNNPPRAFDSEPRARPFADNFAAYPSYSGFAPPNFGPYRSPRSLARPGNYSGSVPSSGFIGDYEPGYLYRGGVEPPFPGESSLYTSRYHPYGGGMGSFSGGFSGYGREAGNYPGSSYMSSYGPGSGPLGSGGLYGPRGGYSSGAAAGRYHPYAR